MLNADNYDFTKSAQIADYVKDCVDEYRKDPRNRKDVVNSLKVVFNPDSNLQLKILSGLTLSSICARRIGVRRLPMLQELLNDIDKDRYNGVNY